MLNDLAKIYSIDVKDFPVVKENDILKLSLELMSKYRIGISVICNDLNEIQSIFTDGDFRRLILRNQKPLPALLVTEMKNISNKDFLSVNTDTTVLQAIQIMTKNKILNLPVLEGNKLIGILNLERVINFLIDNE